MRFGRRGWRSYVEGCCGRTRAGRQSSPLRHAARATSPAVAGEGVDRKACNLDTLSREAGEVPAKPGEGAALAEDPLLRRQSRDLGEHRILDRNTVRQRVAA